MRPKKTEEQRYAGRPFDPRGCEGCVHLLNEWGMEHLCNYFEDTGKLRSLICPGGWGCSCYEGEGRPRRRAPVISRKRREN